MSCVYLTDHHDFKIYFSTLSHRSTSIGMVHSKIHLIYPGCLRPNVVLTLQNRDINTIHSFIRSTSNIVTVIRDVLKMDIHLLHIFYSTLFFIQKGFHGHCRTYQNQAQAFVLIYSLKRHGFSKLCNWFKQSMIMNNAKNRSLALLLHVSQRLPTLHEIC